MQKNEAAAELGEGVNLKFLGTLLPPLIYMWKYDKNGDPHHTKKAYELGFLDETFALKEGVIAGRAKVNKGELELTAGSLDYSNAMPTSEGFQIMINGDVRII